MGVFSLIYVEETSHTRVFMSYMTTAREREKLVSCVSYR